MTPSTAQTPKELSQSPSPHANYIVVGGGVAGVCCAEELCRLCPNASVTLVSADTVLKGVSIVAHITRTIEELKIEEKHLDQLPYPNLTIIKDIAISLNPDEHSITLSKGTLLHYDKLCIATGGRPKPLPCPILLPTTISSTTNAVVKDDVIITLRDTHSVDQLRSRLKDAKRVVIVGNGGIALEIVHALKGVEIIWVVKHSHIGDAFFDVDAAQFLLEELYREQDMRLSSKEAKKKEEEEEEENGDGDDKTTTTPVADDDTQLGSTQQQQGVVVRITTKRTLGHAVGPKWASSLQSTTSSSSSSPNHLPLPLPAHVTIESQAEVASITYTTTTTTTTSHHHILEIQLTNGSKYKADLVITAIGVDPAVDWVDGTVKRDVDSSNSGGGGGLVVGPDMQTNIAGIYAAGDAASIHFPDDNDDNNNGNGSTAMPRTWFQMRLWHQARSAGIHTAHSMAGVANQTASDMAFELFTHATRFLGKRVILLGLYNGQGLGDEDAADMVSYSRVGSSDHHHGGGGCCRKHTTTSNRGKQRQHDDDDDDERTFVRVLLLRGRVIGAVLIGETGLEEALENLILDRLDVGMYGPSLLDPDFELDHVFD